MLELTLFGEQIISFLPAHAGIPVSCRCLSAYRKKRGFLGTRCLACGGAPSKQTVSGGWKLRNMGPFRHPGLGIPWKTGYRCCPPVANNAEFYFRTPVQLSRLAGKPGFLVLIQSVIARLRDLKRIYCASDNDMGHFSKQFWAKAGEVRLLSDLGPEKFEWYSHHRQKQIHLGGLTGSMIFKGDLMPFLPLLAAGFFTGMGRKTVYGLGRFGDPGLGSNPCL